MIRYTVDNLTEEEYDLLLEGTRPYLTPSQTQTNWATWYRDTAMNNKAVKIYDDDYILGAHVFTDKMFDGVKFLQVLLILNRSDENGSRAWRYKTLGHLSLARDGHEAIYWEGPPDSPLYKSFSLEGSKSNALHNPREIMPGVVISEFRDAPTTEDNG